MNSIQENPVQNTTQVKSGSRIRAAGIGGIVLFVLVAAGAIPRIASNREALAATNEAPVTHPIVTLIHASKGEPTSQLVLPGNIEPLYTANLFARTNGYIERRNVDIGAKVRAGQVLAVISSPEVDEQLGQAKATLAQSQAALLQTRALAGESEC